MSANKQKYRRMLGWLLVTACVAVAPLAWAGDEVESRDIALRASEALRDSLVVVRIHFKKDEERPNQGMYGSMMGMDQSSIQYEALVDMKMTVDVAGIVFRDANHVMIHDSVHDEKWIDHYEIVAPDGTGLRAKVSTILAEAAALVIETSGGKAAGLRGRLKR